MNRRTASRADILLEQYNLRQSVEQFRRVIDEINGPIANASPHLKELVSKLYDEGKNNEAGALAKEFREIVNHTQKLSKLGSLLSTNNCGGSVS